MRNSSRTEARVAWNAVLCCSNRAPICSLALFLLSQTRVIVMPSLCTSTGLSSCVSNTFDCGPLFVCKHLSQPWVSNTSDLRFLVFVHASVSGPVVWIVVPCLSTSICLQPWVSNTFDVRFFFCVHASVNSPLFQTGLIMVACLFTSISLEPKWLRVTWINPCNCLAFQVVWEW